MKTLQKLGLFLLIAAISAFGQRVEITKMNAILDEVTPDSLVVFDLDNTIMEASQTLGSDQWFDYRVNHLKSQGVPTESAISQTVTLWIEINKKGRVNLVEEETPSIVRQIQNDGIPTMGLTARPVAFANHSLSQLRNLQVSLHRLTITNKVIGLMDKEPALFKKGLMSVGGNNKGTILVALLNEVAFHPGKILFVDDKMKNIKNVSDALTTLPLPHIGFRYGAADPKVHAFDSQLADFELNYFLENSVVLTDYSARRMMP